MLWFIVCVAVLNMAAGFGLAVFLANGPAGEAVFTCENLPDDVASDDVEPELSDQVDMDTPTDTPSSAAADDEPEISEGAESNATQDAEDPPELSGNSVMADLDAAVSLALGDATLPESENDNSSSDQGELVESQEEQTLQAYHSQLESFCEELAALDDRLRQKRPEETSELQSHLDSVVECSEKQDEACHEAEQSLRDMITAETIDEKRGEAIIAAIQEERQEAAETLEALEHLDSETDPGTQCDMVLDRTAKLLDTNHGLRDDVCDLISATEVPDTKETANASVDPLTEIMSRSALDFVLAEHWKKDPHRARIASLTVIDLDYFAKFNRNYGPSVGNRVLRALAQLIASESPADCHVARFAGQRFALLAIDRDLKQAVSDAERLRQTIETVQLEYGETDLEVTVSCGVVTATQDDTQETLYTRAIESVQEAKRYGRNRTFVHEGEYPTPVVPPNFTLNEKHVTV